MLGLVLGAAGAAIGVVVGAALESTDFGKKMDDNLKNDYEKLVSSGILKKKENEID
jgi:hypothetical protein